MDNNYFILIRLIEVLKIPVTKVSVKNEFDNHPEANSMFAISDILKNWNIDSRAFRVNSDDLKDLPIPFIAKLSSNNGEFVLVEDFNENSVVIFNKQFEHYRMPSESFKSLFSDYVLVFELNNNSGEQNYNQKRLLEIFNKFRNSFLIFLLFSVLFCSIFNFSPISSILQWQILYIAFFKTIGLTVCIILLLQSINSNNSIINYICINNSKTNCSSILSSSAAIITKGLTWAELGYFYFASTWLMTIFYSNSYFILYILAWLNVFCLPYTFYSIFYQFRIAKQWCILCCIIQVIFWIEFSIYFPNQINNFFVPVLSDIVNLILCLSLPLLLWIVAKPYLKKDQELIRLRKEIRTFKFNRHLFTKALNYQPKYSLLSESETFNLGNPEGTNILTLVSNPYCFPCSKAHRLVENLLRKKSNLKVQVVFKTDNDEDGLKATFVKHLFQLELEYGATMAREALQEWYQQEVKDYTYWHKVYPIKEKLNFNGRLEKQNEWCLKSNVNGTPNIFLNGRKLPDPWRLEDIEYFL